MSHRGLTFWYNTALITFAAVAIGMTWSVMGAGFSSSDVMKHTVDKAVQDASNNLKVIGKVTGSANITDGKVKLTVTPITASSTGLVNMKPEDIQIAYTIIKTGSYQVSYDNIYAGILDGSFSSPKEAIDKANSIGLIKANPYDDSQKPDRTVAFVYWVINQNNNVYLENNEIANLVVIYADRDRPSATEFIKMQVMQGKSSLLNIERTIPNVSGSVLDLGGKIKH